MKNNPAYQDSDFFLEVIHKFVTVTSSAETPQEIFTAITKNFMEMLEMEECVVYEAVSKEKKLYQRAIHGSVNPKGEMNNNIQELNYGVGLVGWVAEHQETVCLGDVRNDTRYIYDDHFCLSELVVPIQFNGELFGVIDSENSNENYHTLQHVQLFELIADLAANLFVRIRQKDQLEALKTELENLLDEKKRALETAIETVSDQVSELKYHHERRAILIKEVHHRVNNNLQILSSIISIYLDKNEIIDASTLNAIKQKIQILSSIHLILLKSVENNKTSVQDFLLDLIASIRYMNQTNYLVLEAKSDIPYLPLNTLIPLGLLINETINASANLYWEKGEPVEISVNLNTQKTKMLLELKTSKSFDKETSKLLNPVDEILIDSYIQQLDGENLDSKDKNILWKIVLEEIE